MNCLTFFKALSDETRLRVFNVLLHNELSVNEIVSLMGMGQSRISRHLKILTDSGLLESRRDGVWMFYSAVGKGAGRQFADSISYLFDRDLCFSRDLEMVSGIQEKRRQSTESFFNTVSGEWDRLKSEIIGELDLNKSIMEYVDDCCVAVDLGCGTGDFLSCVGNKADRLIGVDCSQGMLSEAQSRMNNRSECLDLRLGELEHLPIGNNEASLAVVSLVLHHISSPGSAIAEVGRILENDGTLIIADFEKHTNEDMRNIYGDRWLGFSATEIEKLLNDNGFALKDAKCHDVMQNLTLNIYKATKKGE